MNRTLYSLFLYLLSPIILLYFVYRGLKDIRYFHKFSQRFGFANKHIAAGAIHLHCASVGETIAARPLIEKLLERFPEHDLLITSTTPTGRHEAIKLKIKLTKFQSRIYLSYLPIDWPLACKRFVRRTSPRISLLMETELWPNLLHYLGRSNIPVLLVNGRMSKKSRAGYQQYQTLSNQIFANVSKVLAQYQTDGNNFAAIGVPENRIKITGSIKFDLSIPDDLKIQQQQLKQLWAPNRSVWIAASIHPGEFDSLLSAHRRLLEQIPNLLLITVPRHPEQFSEMKNQCLKHKFSFISRTDDSPPSADMQVVVIDTMGEMLLMYGVADIAFVGGSLIERGGHNPIEPAACGIPVIMGDSQYNFADVCEIMKSQGILTSVSNEATLYQAIHYRLSDTQRLKQESMKTKQLFKENCGAVEKIVTEINSFID